MTWTHSQGQSGVVKEAVGGTSLVNDDYLSAIQAKSITDERCWGRYSGRTLQGTDLLVLSVYMPFKSLTSEGSAWCRQAKAMESMSDDERQQDPWYQAVYDVIAVVKNFRLGSKTAGVREGPMVVIGGDFNQTLEHRAGDDAATRDRTNTLQKLMAEADAGEAMKTLHCGVDVITYEQSEERETNRSWIDHVMVPKTVLARGPMSEAGVLQHERFANSDHKLYVVEMDLDTILQLGPAWKHTPDEKHSLPKLPLQE